MVVRNSAAPPTPWSKNLAEPSIHQSAYIHAFSNIIGDVKIGANVMIAPGTSIRADEGQPFHIGEGTNIQDGVVIHGLHEGRVVGDDQNHYSVWIGKNTSIYHMALIHGPAYIGDNCFIGFRSTVFNARVGHGCIVMMHALVQDVEIPAGKYVPSGAVITNQQQADRLPNVQPEDTEFTRNVVGINDALRAGYQCIGNEECIAPIRNELTKHQDNGASGISTTSYKSMSLSPEIFQQVRQLLQQGYRIGTEHVDQRKFRTGSWSSCSPIIANNDREAMAAIETCIANHAGEYVRMFGIDPKAKRRVLETIIQRPDGSITPGANAAHVVTEAPPVYNSYTTTVAQPVNNYAPAPPVGYVTTTTTYPNQSYAAGAAHLSPETVTQVRQLLQQGYQIGTEHVDERRFRTGSWASCSPITARNDQEAIAALETCIANHAGEYVRMFGIDPKAKRRVLETIIQRPDGSITPGANAAHVVTEAPPVYNSYTTTVAQPVNNYAPAPPVGYVTTTTTYPNQSYAAGAAHLSPETVTQVRQLLQQGYQIGTEHVDERRFRTGSWASCSPITARNDQEAITALETCIANHAGEYVRMFGIDPKAKRRVLETIIQRPDGQVTPVVTQTGSYQTNNNYNQPAVSANRPVAVQNQNTRLHPEIVEQLRQLLAQGHRISAEHVDERRFRTNSWATCGQIDTRNDAEAIAVLESFLREYAGEYVRLVGVDPKAKRRVVETIIQRPSEPVFNR